LKAGRGAGREADFGLTVGLGFSPETPPGAGFVPPPLWELAASGGGVGEIEGLAIGFGEELPGGATGGAIGCGDPFWTGGTGGFDSGLSGGLLGVTFAVGFATGAAGFAARPVTPVGAM